MLNKVPQVTIFFWNIKILCTTVGETAADLRAYFAFKINGILAFWLAYILTRPLGASLGDLLSQPHKLGGLGLGTVDTSAIFLTMILALVVYLSVTKREMADAQSA